MAAFWGACHFFYLLLSYQTQRDAQKTKVETPCVVFFPSAEARSWQILSQCNHPLLLISERCSQPCSEDGLRRLTSPTFLPWGIMFGSYHNKPWPFDVLSKTLLPGKLGSFKDIDLYRPSPGTFLILWGCSPTHSFARWIALSAKPRQSHLPDILRVNPELPGWAFFLSWPWPWSLTLHLFHLSTQPPKDKGSILPFHLSTLPGTWQAIHKWLWNKSCDPLLGQHKHWIFHNQQMAPCHVRMKWCDSALSLAYSVISRLRNKMDKTQSGKGTLCPGVVFQGQKVRSERMQGAWGCGNRQDHIMLCVFTLVGGLDYILYKKGSQWRFEIREQSWYFHSSSLQRIGSVSVWDSIIKFQVRIESKCMIPEGKGGEG